NEPNFRTYMEYISCWWAYWAMVSTVRRDLMHLGRVLASMSGPSMWIIQRRCTADMKNVS
ncbi:hypothetical protein LTR40_010975, partial [Exophiala xenobiotica]